MVTVGDVITLVKKWTDKPFVYLVVSLKDPIASLLAIVVQESWARFSLANAIANDLWWRFATDT